MKTVLSVFICTMFLVSISFLPGRAQLLKRLKDKVAQTASDHVTNDAGNATDNTINNAEHPSSGNSNTNQNNSSGSTGAGITGNLGTNAAPSTASYQNYDFVPGDTILFEDDFTEDQDGEFPSHWDLEKGQAVVNKMSGEPAFCLTEGNYCQVYPLMKTKSYLTNPFTVEFDYYPRSGASGPIVFLQYKDSDGSDDHAEVNFANNGSVSTGYLPHDFSADYPNEEDNTYFNKWHHCAMIYKDNQLKCYVDQYRVLVVPNVGIVPISLGFGGIGDMTNPIVITGIRVAAGGNMNMIGKKFTASKIVTHGITFDIDKADIKPESMGTLNMIVGVMKGNPDLKFEIDGHTDNTGDATHNMTLSQQRADAVKTQLVSMGIDASRLSTKGFGDTRPIDTNDTPEGRANNRRVEFIKM
jgi:OmpA-OmpF porin, OOP family